MKPTISSPHSLELTLAEPSFRRRRILQFFHDKPRYVLDALQGPASLPWSSSSSHSSFIRFGVGVGEKARDQGEYRDRPFKGRLVSKETQLDEQFTSPRSRRCSTDEAGRRHGIGSCRW